MNQRNFNISTIAKWLLAAALVVLPIILGLQSYFNSVTHNGASCPHYSTYQVFKHAHFHLLGDQDIYSYHEEEHCFTFKYSPAFALAFGVFAYLPDWLALVLWMLLSGMITLITIRALPEMGLPKQLLFFVVILFEWMVSVQGQQTNVLLVMSLLLAFLFLEKGKPLPATLLIVMTGFIKIFGFGAMLLFLFYPGKLRMALYSVGWVILFATLPLVVLEPAQLWGIYEDWHAQITSDYGQYKGLSFYSFVESVFLLTLPKPMVLAASLLLLLSPLTQLGKWKQLWFRKLMLASILIWVVIFNHKAESHSYIIAMTGIALWYFDRERKWLDTALLVFAFLVVSILFSDLVPRWVKFDFGFVYSLKALPCTLIWLRILAEIWLRNNPKESVTPPLVTVAQ